MAKVKGLSSDKFLANIKTTTSHAKKPKKMKQSHHSVAAAIKPGKGFKSFPPFKGF